MKNRKTLFGIAGLLAFGLAATGQTEVTVVASSNGTIRADGPTGSPWFHNAQVAGDFASYAISSFVLTADQFGEGEVSSIDSVSISYTQANAGFTTDGPVGLHMTFDTTVGGGDYSGLSHDGSAAGVDDAQFADAPVAQAVASGTFTQVESGTEDVYTLDVSGVEAELLAAINAGEPFSVILIAPGDAGAVTYAGIENNTYPEMTKLTVSASVGGGSGGDGEVVTLFENAADLANFTVTNSTNSDTVLVDASTTPASALDGDAVRQFDFDDAGRTTLRYTPDNAVNAGIQYSFDGYIDPASTGIVVMRVGNDLASMAGIKGAGLSVVFDSNGDVKADIANPESDSGRSQELYEAAVTPGTPFNVSVVFNAAVEGDLMFSLGGSDLTLAPQAFAVFVDDVLLGTDLPVLSAASTGDGSYNFDPAAGAQDVWWFSGGASSQAGMDFQFDNIVVKTGAAIGDGPPIVVETALMITGVLDATLPGGTPKVIELYALEDIADLSVYGIGSANNGGGTDGVELTLEGSASAGDYIWIASEDVEFANVFGFAPEFVSGAAAINGDDAIELFLNDEVVDVFGDIDVDGNGEPWEYLDGWAYRNDESMPDGTFVLADWTFSGPDALDDLDAAGIAAAVPFGTYSPGGGGEEPAPLGPNFLTNAGFESGIDDWEAFNGAGPSAEGEPVRSGTGSLKLDGSGGSYSVPGAFQSYPAEPGDLINAQAYILSPDAIPEGNTFGGVKIVFSDGTGDLQIEENPENIGVINTANPGMESVPFVNSEFAAGEWVLTTAQAVAPAGTVSVSIFILNVNESGVVYYADDVTAVNVVPNLLTNAGFESGIDDWEAFNGAGPSGDGDPVLSGSGSLKLDGIGGGYSVPGAFQSFDAAPGDLINAQAYITSPDAIPAGNTFGTVKIVFSDGTSDLQVEENPENIGVINTANPGMESVPFVNSDFAAGDWVLTTAQAVAPAGTVSVSIFVLNVNESGVVFFADNVMASLTPPEVEPLPWEGVGVDEMSVSPWFGSFTGGTDDWIQHDELGWIYVGLVEVSDNMWLYSYYWDTWLWTSEELFPIVYATGSNAWLYYFIVEDVGAFVFDYSTYTWSLNP